MVVSVGNILVVEGLPDGLDWTESDEDDSNEAFLTETSHEAHEKLRLCNIMSDSDHGLVVFWFEFFGSLAPHEMLNRAFPPVYP